MTQEQVESQLSAMFDGELPAAECELLSRRIDRDENLRARWSRYALIGAAMRSEPVATARRGFAARVSVALDQGDDAVVQPGSVSTAAATGVRRRRGVWRNTALAASMVAAVAGVSIGMLRHSAPGSIGQATLAQAMTPVATVRLVAPAMAPPVVATSSAQPGLVPVEARTSSRTSALSNGEPRSYVTPLNQSGANIGLRTELADFIVAHSEYSTPLIRGNLLSTLVSNEDTAEPSAVTAAAIHAGAGQSNAAAASVSTVH